MKRTFAGLLVGLLFVGCSGDNEMDDANNGVASSGLTCFDAQTALEDATRALPLSCDEDADCQIYEDDPMFCDCLILTTENQDVSTVTSASTDYEGACEVDCAQVTCAHGSVGAPKEAYCDGNVCRSR